MLNYFCRINNVKVLEKEYGENINIIEQNLLNNIKVLKNNVMNLYDPFITLTQKDFYPVITTTDNAMTVSLIGESVNTPIESYIDYYETVHLLLDNVNVNKYLQNLPSFLANFINKL
mgnify:CR=1 FL=1